MSAPRALWTDDFSNKIYLSICRVVRSLENLENLEMSGNFFLVRENLENLEKSGNFVEIAPSIF